MADQLTTTAKVKARLGITDGTDDVVIAELIDQVSDWIQEYTGRKLVPEAAVTYVVDTAAGSVISVPRGIRAVTALSIALTDQPDAGGVYTAIAAADILLRPLPNDRKPGWPATRILLRNPAIGRLAAALNGAVIVGDFGFVATPPGIEAIATDTVVTAYTARQGATDTIGDPEALIPEGSPQRATLERYKAGVGIGIG